MLQLAFFVGLLLITAFVLCALNLRGLRVDHEHAESVFAGETLPVRISVRSERRQRTSYAVELADELLGNDGFARARPAARRPWPAGDVLQGAEVQPGWSVDLQPPGVNGDGAREEVLARFRRRGCHSRFRFCLSSDFPFGLFRHRREGVVDSSLAVYPRPAFPPALARLLAAGSGEDGGSRLFSRDCMGEFHGLREFTVGDSLRLVHWPLSAHYGEIVVKEFEPSAPAHNVVIFHSSHPRGKGAPMSAEQSLEILCGLFLHLYHSGARFDFLADFNNWHPIAVDSDWSALEAALLTLALARIRPSPNTGALVRNVDAAAARNTRVIVMSNIPCGHWQHLLAGRDRVYCLDNRLRLRQPQERVR